MPSGHTVWQKDTMLMSQPIPDFFDGEWYLRSNPDVAAARADPLAHFNRFGRFEGRMPCAVRAAALEKAVWAGLKPVKALQDLLQDESPAEQSWAGFALARISAATGDWTAAKALLASPRQTQALLSGFGLLSPALMLIEAAERAGDMAGAHRLLGWATARFGSRPELQLMTANLRLGDASAWALAVKPVFAGARLILPQVLGPTTTEQTRFDQLYTKPRRGWPYWGRRPLVSVVVPMFNAADSLGTSVRSILAQSWPELEILLVENASTDATLGVAQALANDDPRIRILDASADPGAYAARNIGMAAARGDFVTVQDADDWAHPQKIERQLRALLRRPNAAASISHWVRATPDLRFTNTRADVGLVHRNMSSLMIRRAARQRLGFWDRVKVGADTEYFYRLLQVCGADALCEVLPGVPLSFGRQSAKGLTQDPALGLLSKASGARQAYHKASRIWHKGEDPDRLCLPQYPTARPFAAPTDMVLPNVPHPPQVGS